LLASYARSMAEFLEARLSDPSVLAEVMADADNRAALDRAFVIASDKAKVRP